MTSTPIETEDTYDEDIYDEDGNVPEKDAAPMRTVLELWQELLKSIEPSRAERVSPQVASKIVTSWPHMTFQEIPGYFVMYHDYLAELRDILTAEIEEHPEALERKEKDATENAQNYYNLLLLWQCAVVVWETDWDTSQPAAGPRMAAMADATDFYLGQGGLVAHLGRIGLKMDDEDSEVFRVALQEWKDAL